MKFPAIAVAITLGLLTVASAEPSAPAAQPTTVKVPARAQFYANGLPAPYRGMTNPLQTNVPNVIRGADLYNANCASCHGLMGFGNGAASGGLPVRPADLAWSLSAPDVKDDFLYWTIAEGGAQFRSPMPGFKGQMKDFQIWEVVTYMRAAFEGREASLPAPGKQAMAEASR
ncbi:MAG: c-type cytochrome [Alphaproteobacteria bacterium]|nr:c-type cytochrome [Alphaproteobacteria bacterium]